MLSVQAVCGAVEPVVERALRVRALGADVPVCAWSDFAGATSDRS
ncbi:hypothetical protein ACO0M4_28070 [Streptomyces sp. RGM 3693]